MSLPVTEGILELFLVLCYLPHSPWSFSPAKQKGCVRPSATAPMIRRHADAPRPRILSRRLGIDEIVSGTSDNPPPEVSQSSGAENNPPQKRMLMSRERSCAEARFQLQGREACFSSREAACVYDLRSLRLNPGREKSPDGPENTVAARRGGIAPWCRGDCGQGSGSCGKGTPQGKAVRLFCETEPDL